MDVIEAIRERCSIRNFLPEPVPRETIERILDTAVWAPSAMNTQPWEFAVLTGEPLERLKTENISRLTAGKTPVFEFDPKGWEKKTVYHDRQVGLAKLLFAAMGIGREDKQKRDEWTMRGFRFFDAPCAVIVLTDRSLRADAPLFDLGAVVQTLCLAAVNERLGTCIEMQGILYPDLIREIAGIPDTKRVVIGVALGYPDPDFPANQVRTPREGAAGVTTFAG